MSKLTHPAKTVMQYVFGAAKIKKNVVTNMCTITLLMRTYICTLKLANTQKLKVSLQETSQINFA